MGRCQLGGKTRSLAHYLYLSAFEQRCDGSFYGLRTE